MNAPATPPSAAIACPLCEHSESEVVYREGEQVVVRCSGCSFYYHDPRCPGEDSSESYSEDFYRGGGMVDNPHKVAFFEDRYQRWFSHLPPGDVLDVGCGVGDFLNVMKGHGWRPHAVEASPWASDFLRERLGLTEVFTGQFEELELPPASMDLVHMNHSLEHCISPVTALKNAMGVLRPGGTLFIEVPNEISNPKALYKRVVKGRGFVPGTPPPIHRCYFTRATLRMALNKAGFEGVRITQEGVRRKIRRDAYPVPLKKAILKLVCRTGLDELAGIGVHVMAVAHKPASA